MARDLPFNLGVVLDEIDADPDVALPIAAELGFTSVELNTIRGRPVHALTDGEADDLRAQIERHGLRVCCVSPPALKAVLLDDVLTGGVAAHPAVAEHLGWTRRAGELAMRFDAGLVRIFSFRKSGMVGLGNPSPRLAGGGPLPDDALAKIAEGLRAAGDIATEAGVTLAVENVRSCWGNTGENTARLLAATDHPRVRAIWDPGNDYVSGGVPFPHGYAAIRPWLAHVHVKDAVVEDAATGRTRWECIGRGEVDYAGQLHALIRDGYAGVVCVETHWRPPGRTGAQCTQETLAGLRTILAQIA